MNPIAQGELVASALRVFEVIGVLAFAASGLIEAARKKFDIFGVVLIAFIAAFGGGTLRDILLDRRPFFWVENQELLWLVIAFAVLAPLFFRARHIEFTSRAMEWPDAVGLGLFATSGAQLALDAGATPFIAAVMAVGVVYNTARVAWAERAWELASLRVLGCTRGEVGAWLLGEWGLLIGLALPLGLALGDGLVRGLAHQLQSDQFQFPVVMPTVTVPFPRNHGTAGLEEFDGTGTIFPAQEPERLSG